MSNWVNKPVGFKRTDKVDMTLHEYTTKVAFTDITKQWWQTVYNFTNGNPNDTYKIYKLLEDFKSFISGSSLQPETVSHNVTQSHITSHKITQPNLRKIEQNHTTLRQVTQSPKEHVPIDDPPSQFLL